MLVEDRRGIILEHRATGTLEVHHLPMESHDPEDVPQLLRVGGERRRPLTLHDVQEPVAAHIHAGGRVGPDRLLLEADRGDLGQGLRLELPVVELLQASFDVGTAWATTVVHRAMGLGTGPPEGQVDTLEHLAGLAGDAGLGPHAPRGGGPLPRGSPGFRKLGHHNAIPHVRGRIELQVVLQPRAEVLLRGFHLREDPDVDDAPLRDVGLDALRDLQFIKEVAQVRVHLVQVLLGGDRIIRVQRHG
jgi:hypothetical protein